MQNQQENIFLVRAHIMYTTYFFSGKNCMSKSTNPEKKQKTSHTWEEKLRTMESNKPETNLTVKNLVIKLLILLLLNTNVIKYKFNNDLNLNPYITLTMLKK